MTGISKLRMLQISEVVHAMVCTEFSMMCNPLYRGPKFSWGIFKDMCRENIKANLFIYFRSKTPDQAMYDYADMICCHVVDKMLSNSGFLENNN